MSQAFDINTFKRNIDPKQLKQSLTVAGKKIDLPEDNNEVAVQINGEFIRVGLAKAEHRELQLAGESRVHSTEYIYNSDGVEIVKFETDTGWATSSAPRLDLIPQDMKTKLPTNMRDIKTGKKIIQ